MQYYTYNEATKYLGWPEGRLRYHASSPKSKTPIRGGRINRTLVFTKAALDWLKENVNPSGPRPELVMPDEYLPDMTDIFSAKEAEQYLGGDGGVVIYHAYTKDPPDLPHHRAGHTVYFTRQDLDQFKATHKKEWRYTRT